MARVPFPEGIVGSDKLPRTRRSLTNLFNNGGGRLIPRPGLDQLNNTNLLARGQFEWNGALYQVFGTNLNKITNTTTGAFTTIGTIAGTADIEHAIGFNTAVIIVRGGNLYTLDKSDTLVDISGNANIVPSVDVAHINGRFVYIPADGSVAFFSDVGAAGTVQADSFFDAESLPDLNKANINIGDILYIFGTDSIEPFQDTGATPNPFTRIANSRIDVGYIGGLTEFHGEGADSSALFIGRKRKQRSGIFLLKGGSVTKISNEAIADILSTYTEAQLADAVTNYFVYRDYDIATITLGNHSFGFHAGQWFFLTTLFSLVPSPWGGGFITQFKNEYFSCFDDKISKLTDSVNTDFGEKIERSFDIGFEQESGDWMTGQRVKLGMSQGYNSTVGTIGLAMSRNNVEYGPMIFRQTGALGEYGQQVVWNPPGGLGQYEGFMGMRVYTTQDLVFSGDYLSVDLR